MEETVFSPWLDMVEQLVDEARQPAPTPPIVAVDKTIESIVEGEDNARVRIIKDTFPTLRPPPSYGKHS